MNRLNSQLIFENGRQFWGTGFGTIAHSVAEVVYSTSMVGYQELISDPSLCAQMVCMTYPLIGNYGMADDDYESRKPYLSGLIVREYNDIPSNYRYTRTLSDVMIEHGVPGIAGVDTRAITRMIRDEGSMRALITSVDTPKAEGLAKLSQAIVPHDQVRRVSCRKVWYARTANFRYNVVAIDYGIKFSIIRSLNERGCNVTILPCDATAEQVRAFRPDGVLISNGPGDPADVPQALSLIKALQGEVPIFGICLGHLLIALANGAKTYQMKSGHHGGNHPVKDLRTGRIVVTSQGHGYAVDAASLAGTSLTQTHANLLDGTVEGLANEDKKVFSVQFHPEGAGGPQDSIALFDRFIAMMATQQEVAHA